MMKYKPIPEFSQYVEYVTQGDLVDGEYQVIVNHVDLSQQPIVEAAETLKSGYEHVETLNRLPAIEGQELDGVKVRLSETYHEDIVTEATKTTNPINITGTVAEVKTYPNFQVGESVKVGDVRFYLDNLYKCIQAHTTQAEWDPITAKALYKRYYEPDDDPWEWVQPLGAHDAYPLGAKVLFEGDVWESTITANVWQPGVTGWKNLSGTTPETYADWVQPTGAHDAYNIGDKVIFDGHLWESLINTNVWSPTVYPAGWKDLGVYP